MSSSSAFTLFHQTMYVAMRQRRTLRRIVMVSLVVSGCQDKNKPEAQTARDAFTPKSISLNADAFSIEVLFDDGVTGN